MRTIRCFSTELNQNSTNITINNEEALHLVKVLRLKQGDCIEIINGKGIIAKAIVENINQEKRSISVFATITEIQKVEFTNKKITLYIATPKGKLMSQIIRDATELGVYEIQPIICRYSVVDLSSKDTQQLWQAATIDACKQSGNPFLPIIKNAVKLDEALSSLNLPGFFGAVPLENDNKDYSSIVNQNEISIWIGPEGGFSDEEHEKLRKSGLAPMTVGAWILRVETAVTALLGNILAKK